MPEQTTTTFKTYLPMPPIQGYEEIRPLGKGGFGSVYLVSDDADRLLALKVIMHRETDDYRYTREYESIRTCGDLNHPDLIRILHVGKGADFFYYTMSLADDALTGRRLSIKSTEEEINSFRPKTLKSEIQSAGGHLSIKAAVEAVLPVLSALEFLHGKVLLHRDVKPDNIVYLDGKPVLGDIGLVTEQTDDTMTRVESPGFTPPGGVTDVACDLYSVGKTIHCAIGGDVVRPGLAVPTCVVNSPDPLFQPLNKIIIKATNLRYESAKDMKTALEKLLKQKRTRKIDSECKTHALKHDDPIIEQVSPKAELSNSQEIEPNRMEVTPDLAGKDSSISDSTPKALEGDGASKPTALEVESKSDPKTEDGAAVIEQVTSSAKTDSVAPTERKLVWRKDILEYYADKKNSSVQELSHEDAVRLFVGYDHHEAFIGSEPMPGAGLGFIWKIHRKMYTEGILTLLAVLGLIIIFCILFFLVLSSSYRVAGAAAGFAMAVKSFYHALVSEDRRKENTSSYREHVNKKVKEILNSSPTLEVAMSKIHEHGGTNYLAAACSLLLIIFSIGFVLFKGIESFANSNTEGKTSSMPYTSSYTEYDKPFKSTYPWQSNNVPQKFEPGKGQKTLDDYVKMLKANKKIPNE